jgi:hypothetical protein
MASRKPQRPRMTVSQNAPSTLSPSAAVWQYLESQPGFNEHLREVEKRLDAGGGALYEVRDGALHKVRRPKGSA